MDSDGGKLSPELKHFLASETERQKVRILTKALADRCFDRCLPNPAIDMSRSISQYARCWSALFLPFSFSLSHTRVVWLITCSVCVWIRDSISHRISIFNPPECSFPFYLLSTCVFRCVVNCVERYLDTQRAMTLQLGGRVMFGENQSERQFMNSDSWLYTQMYLHYTNTYT